MKTFEDTLNIPRNYNILATIYNVPLLPIKLDNDTIVGRIMHGCGLIRNMLSLTKKSILSPFFNN